MDLRGASADALAGLTDDLTSAISTNTSAGEIGDELFVVAITLRAEGALRRVLTDGSVPAEPKQGLAADVFASKVGDATSAVIASAVGRRWTAARDLADTLEHLSVVAQVTSAGARSGRLVDELFAFAQAVKDNPDLRDALSDPSRSTADKSTLLDTLLGDKALPAAVSLAKQSLAGTYRTVSSALAAYQRVAADVHGQGVATVRVARDLTPAETERLSQALSAQYGQQVHLNLLVDPSVLGGILVEIGDDVIDGTISSRLDDARRAIAG